jgi:hypothetical protein
MKFAGDGLMILQTSSFYIKDKDDFMILAGLHGADNAAGGAAFQAFLQILHG